MLLFQAATTQPIWMKLRIYKAYNLDEHISSFLYLNNPWFAGLVTLEIHAGVIEGVY